MGEVDTRRMCPHCRAFITTRDRTCPYCGEKVGPRAIDRRSPADILGGLIPHARFTTVVILTINFGLYIATVLYSMKSGNDGAFMNIDGRTLLIFGAKYRPAIFLGQWWRLVTAGFLHGGLLHIAMNSWVLFDLGTQVEEVYGTARMVVIYWMGTVFGFLLSTYWSNSLSVGASAGLFGFIGAMIALGMGSRHPMAGAVRAHYIRWAVYMLLFGLLPGLRVDTAAHVGGLAAGFGVAYLAGVQRLETLLRERIWRWAMYVVLLLTGYCFLRMYFFFERAAAQF
jgi:rhomboid protease GluP